MDIFEVEKNEDRLLANLKKCGIKATANMMNKFAVCYKEIVEKNKTMNLTAITEMNEFFDKHFIDSIIAEKYIPRHANVLDLGCGAGFPGIPLKIVRNDIALTSIDSTSKKIDFVKELEEKLELENVETKSVRAEEFGQNEGREKFDVVVSRAVANTKILLELAIPLLKTNGIFIAYKTDENELEGLENAQKELNCRVKEIKTFTLPNGANRKLFVFEKIGHTNEKYPRQFGKIKNKPL